MAYRAWLSAFVLLLALTLLALVDFRRGFLFATYSSRSLFYAFHPAQLVMLGAVGCVVASAMYRMLPPAFGNNLPSVVLSAAGGTLFMISTWSEIPMALQLIQSGFSGPAAALLIVLPAVSLPCMMLLGGSLRRFRLVGMLSAAVMVVGIVTGLLFL